MPHLAARGPRRARRRRPHRRRRDPRRHRVRAAVRVTPDVTLYGHWTCPFVHRVAWALAERGIEHGHVDVPPSAVRPKDFVLPEEFVAHSPRLEIPMVRVGEEYLADSIPVLEWLEVVVPDAPPLLPRDD
ncbi:MAG TPA: hypothetical protein DCS55_13445, partial [Acidimicrobiaceae bacterium]|nr:hypothetical protein [Acidimicrobiaceae bacterium]